MERKSAKNKLTPAQKRALSEVSRDVAGPKFGRKNPAKKILINLCLLGALLKTSGCVAPGYYAVQYESAPVVVAPPPVVIVPRRHFERRGYYLGPAPHHHHGDRYFYFDRCR